MTANGEGAAEADAAAADELELHTLLLLLLAVACWPYLADCCCPYPDALNVVAAAATAAGLFGAIGMKVGGRDAGGGAGFVHGEPAVAAAGAAVAVVRG